MIDIVRPTWALHEFCQRAPQLEKASAPVTILTEKLNRYFQVFREGQHLYQTEYEQDSSGKEVFRSTRKLEYVIGSGANGHSYLVRRGDYLFQAPLLFYSRPNKWDLSPGYEFQDYGFSRMIQERCVACHSGQPLPDTQGNGLLLSPPFPELVIGCENCHGPGQLHVEERAKGLPTSNDGDRSIVNPARLPLWMADNICMSCHQGGDTQVLQPGKRYLDFRPAPF